MKRTRLASAAAAVAFAATAIVTSAGTASADPAHCYGWNTHPDRWSGGNVSFGDGAFLRRGPYTDCDSFGQGFPSHGIDVHCVVTNSSGIQWFWVRDTSTGVSGWVSENALRFGAVLIPGC